MNSGEKRERKTAMVLGRGGWGQGRGEENGERIRLVLGGRRRLKKIRSNRESKAGGAQVLKTRVNR
jgi:hypothetical protein